MNYFNCNGKLFEAHTAVIGPDNRGLRFGDGLFETLKCSKGQLLMADEHFARLWKGMQVLQFQVPKLFSPDTLQEEISALLKKNGHQQSARIRVTVYRGDGGLFDAVNHIPNHIIQSWELPETNGQWNSNGLVLGIYDEVKKSPDILSNLKHNNYLSGVMAALYAKAQKWNDAIILNTAGRICETTIANIFLIRDGIVSTPALAEGCVAGVFRKLLLRELASQDIKVMEKEIDQDELMQADEIFLTNAIYNIRWVQGIGGKVYDNRLTQKIYSTLPPTIL